MASIGIAPNGPNPNVPATDLPLPNETWDQYLYRLYNERQYDQQRAQQDARTQMQMQSSLADRRAQMQADAAYQRSQQSINNSRNEMTLTDLDYQQALDADRLRNTRIGSVNQSYRNAGLGTY